MRRRHFVLLTASTLALLPHVAQSQPPKQQYSIGYLSPLNPSTDAVRSQAFLRGLHELGYVEGQNINIKWRFADGKFDQLSALAADLVNQRVDLIVVAGGDPIARVVESASKTIPIVLAVGEDPLADGLVASLAHPGGNITGVTSLTRAFSAKRLQFVKEMCPTVSNVAVVWNTAFPNKIRELKATEVAAKTLNLGIIDLGIQKANELDKAFELVISRHADALVSLPDPLTNVLAGRIIQLAKTRRLPTMFSQKAPVAAGGLMSYGPNYADLFRQAAAYVDKILKGANPADLPMEQPTEFELVVNLRTAKEIGVTVPPRLLAITHDLIE